MINQLNLIGLHTQKAELQYLTNAGAAGVLGEVLSVKIELNIDGQPHIKTWHRKPDF